MGFNTAMMVLEFGRKVAEEVRDAYSRRPGYRGWQSEFAVLPSQHADYDQLVVIGGNTIRSIDALSDDERVALLKRLARHAGYRLSRTPS